MALRTIVPTRALARVSRDLLRGRPRTFADSASRNGSEEPIRSEVLGRERMEQFARELAASHRLARGRGQGRALLATLVDNRRVLRESYRSLALAVEQSQAISPAAEWPDPPRGRVGLPVHSPFDRTERDPGYIRGYPPGVRENGGQYTHAATWVVIALAPLGEGDEAAEAFSILNPIARTRTRDGVTRHRVEPYAAAADFYSEGPHVGRGGWTWYTGSAGWLSRAGLEWILGLRVRAERLEVEPCIPRGWPGFEVRLRWRSSRYVVSVENPSSVSRGVVSIGLDGVPQPAGTHSVALADDAAEHRVRVVLG
jgi:glycosyl hydrolase family 36/glycosyl hydrolase family 65